MFSHFQKRAILNRHRNQSAIRIWRPHQLEQITLVTQTEPIELSRKSVSTGGGNTGHSKISRCLVHVGVRVTKCGHCVRVVRAVSIQSGGLLLACRTIQPHVWVGHGGRVVPAKCGGVDGLLLG